MIDVRKNVSLAPFTTFCIGGHADHYTEVSCPLTLAEALEYAEDAKLPVCILGGGSNILFSDRGFRGLVIHLSHGSLKVSGERVTAGAGTELKRVVETAAENGLAGLEKLAGIPGSFGGAIRGNAGAFGTEIGDVVTSVKALDQRTGMVKEYRQADCGFAYRSSFFKKHPEVVILSAELRLAEGADRHVLKRLMHDTVARREAKHPQRARCAGSFFMNPVVRDKKLHAEFKLDTGSSSRDERLPAGWLVDHVGLRGRRLGGAQVSERHPNYIVNAHNATAEDVITLASLIKTRVRDELGVRLREEVQLVGF